MDLKDFSFFLPEELIAQHPEEKRDHSRLMLLDKNTGEVSHERFFNIIDYLKPGDCLVLNNTRVIPARLIGAKEGTGGAIEFVLLHRVEGDFWEVILKPGRKAKIGSRFVFGDELRAEVTDIVNEGNRIVRFEYDGIFEEVLDRLGSMPLPPYIKEKLEDKERYQTVYSKHSGSAAAPTAGLHFTRELLSEIEKKGVEIGYVTLHVGLGTFRPVKVDKIEEHHMHSEFYSVEQDVCDKVNRAKKEGRRVIAVGTTSVRTLESIADENGIIKPSSGWTNIFIYPGYRFKAVDALITNFHLSQSTLLMLVSALAGRENVLNAYNTAVQEKYRFFSFGDSMFIC